MPASPHSRAGPSAASVARCPGHSEGALLENKRVHYVKNAMMETLGYSSKLNAEWEFLTMLRDAGRAAAEAFLAENGEHLGHRSTLPFEASLAES